MPTSTLKIVIDAQADAAKGELGAIAKDLMAVGAASDQAAVLQNKLALAMHEAQDAATRLSNAQHALQGNTDPGKQRDLEREVLRAQVALDREAQSALDAGAKLGGLGQKTEGAAAASKSASFSFTELNSAVMLGQQALGAIKGAYDAVIAPTLAYSDQIRTLERNIGATAEESSKLIQAADDTQISFETLNAGLQAAVRKGLTPTIEGLGQLADRYVAIQDPIARDKFLMDSFGRSGADLAALMEKGAAGIKLLGDNAETTGLVMSEQGVQSARKFEIALDDLSDSASGFKMALANGVIPALTNFINVQNAATEHEALLQKAQKLGIDLTWKQAGAYGVTHGAGQDLAASSKYLAEQIDKTTAALDAQTDAFYHTSRAEAAVVQVNADALNIYGPVAAELQLMASSTDTLTNAQARSVLATDAATAAHKDMLINQLVSAGLAGTVTKNTETYNKVLDGNAEKIAKLRAEIEKYTALQGQSVTVVAKGQYSSEQLAAAQERLAIAEQRLSEYHGKSQASLMSLQLSVQTATESVDKMSGHMASATSTTADYSSKIAEDQWALDELTSANSRAEDAMHAANREFALQQAAAGLTGQALLDFELAMGAIDKPTYDATLALQAADAEFKKTGDLGAYESSVRNIIDAMNGVVTPAGVIPDVLKPAADAFATDALKAHDAATALHDFNSEQRQMTDKTVTTNIVTNHLDNWSTTGSMAGTHVPPGASAGASFIIPPGNNENYPIGPFRASSYEEVTIIPAGSASRGAGGGDTIVYNIYDSKTAALVKNEVRQRKLAQLEAQL